MELKYNLTEEDYLNFNLFHIKNSKTANRTLNIQRFLSPIIFMAFSFILAKMGNMSFPGLFISFLVVSILWIVFYPRHFYSSIMRNTKKLIKEGKNEGLLGEHRMLLTEEGLVDTTTNGETKVTWAGIQAINEDQNYIYLYNTSVSAYILPKKDLENVETIKAYIKNYRR